ncbi:predicted protein [Chaetoceros tenuissimus]|uniref:Uncharacterized protein n=1 Tax=Chaetoceros tenuissimus TaxID=426638 RepID=A0AAD3DDQ5_9STRA|nr:predicted protein [Chaetoceros tenuissimus]
MCGGTQLRRLSTLDSDCNMMGNPRRRLSITKSCVKNFIVDRTATRIPSADSSLEDQESINSMVDSVQQQLNTLQKESKVAQLDFQKQIEKMHKDCAERLAKITELKSRLSGLQALKAKEEEVSPEEVVVIMPNTLKRSRLVSSISSISSSASSNRNEDFKIQKIEESSSVSSSRNRFLEHTRSVPAMFESIEVENTYGMP